MQFAFVPQAFDIPCCYLHTSTSQQRLVVVEQHFVYLKNIVFPALNEILNYRIKLAAVRQREACTFKQILRLVDYGARVERPAAARLNSRDAQVEHPEARKLYIDSGTLG
jgi:hypothetical protein